MDLESLVDRAGAAYAEGRFADALQLYQAATVDHPDNGVLHANLSAILLRLDRPEEGRRHAEIAVRLQPEWAKAHFRLGECLRRVGVFPPAVVSLARAAAREPASQQISAALREAAKEAWDEFPLASMQILSLENNTNVLLAVVGQTLLGKGFTTEAVEILEAADALESPSLKLQESLVASLGAALVSVGRHMDAVACYRRQIDIAESLGSDTLSIHRNVARAAEAAGDWRTAVRHRQTAMADPPPSCELICIGELYLQLKDADTAGVYFEKASASCDMTEDEEGARFGQAQVAALKGDCSLALSLLDPLPTGKRRLRAVECRQRLLIREGKVHEASTLIREETSKARSADERCVLLGLCSECAMVGGDAATAASLARKALALAAHNTRLAAATHRLLAEVCASAMDAHSALVLLERYADTTQVVDDRGWAFSRMAELLSRDGRWEEAEHRLMQIEQEDQTLLSSPVKAKCASLLYRLWLERGDSHRASDMLQREKAIVSTSQCGELRAQLYADIAAGDGEDCMSALEQGLTEAQEASQPWWEAAFCERLGEEMEKQGRQKEAEGFYSQQLTVARQLRLAEHMLRGYANLARLHTRRLDWRRGGELSSAALSLAKLTRDDPARIECMRAVAECESKMDNPSQSLLLLKKALRLAETGELHAQRASIHRSLSEVYGELGKPEAMSKQLSLHRSLFPFVSCPVDKCATLLDLADIQATAGDVTQTMQLLEEAESLTDDMDPEAATVACLRCASICRRLECGERARQFMRAAVRSIRTQMAAEEGETASSIVSEGNEDEMIDHLIEQMQGFETTESDIYHQLEPATSESSIGSVDRHGVWNRE